MSADKNSFSENDIRPEDLKEGGWITDIIDTGRMLSRRKDFVPVACPACGSSDFRKKFMKNSLNYLVCTNCETMYISPRPSEEILDWFYSGSATYAYWNKYIFPASEEARRAKIFVPRVDRVLEVIERYQIETGALLEVGAAFGTFCEEVQSRNVFDRVVGIEATPGLAETCRQKGIEVIEDMVENVSFPEDEKFDVVANFEVIEHLFSPKEFIEKCYELLKPGGIFVVTCPNGKGFDFITLGRYCDSADHEHLNYFNPESLSLLLNNTGFEVLEAVTPGQLDAELVRNKMLEGELDPDAHPFLKAVLIDKWDESGENFQKFLQENNLSSNMWLVAQKPK